MTKNVIDFTYIPVFKGGIIHAVIAFFLYIFNNDFREIT